MKTIVFAHSRSDCMASGKLVDFANTDTWEEGSGAEGGAAVDLASVFGRSGKEWLNQLGSWIGGVNQVNSDLYWWAHASTAKNFLSSPLGDRFVQVKAICELAETTGDSTLSIIGATPGQMETLRALLPPSKFRFVGSAWRKKERRKTLSKLKSLVMLVYRASDVLLGFIGYRRPRIEKSPDVCLFTYLDGVRRAGVDNYFGTLPRLLRESKREASLLYLAYVYRPYRRRIRQITDEHDPTPYVALFGLLRTHDHLWALFAAVRVWWRDSRGDYEFRYNGFEAFAPLLRETFVDDLAGVYLFNLLIYRATRRFFETWSPRVVVYPFENKPLEKMILQGIKDSRQKPKIVGYQHTSITPRHITLLFAPGEAAHTPLPEKIVTVGKVTKAYLEAEGNYPPGIFVAGGALRQIWGSPLPRNGGGDSGIRVLLALSSSKNELVRSVAYFRRVVERLPTVELGVRPHPNFPLTLLPTDLAEWVAKHALDLSGTLLNDNLEWSSVTAYVSSTVALEALMRGKPIVNFAIGDVVSPDPVLGQAPFHWCINDESEMVRTLGNLKAMRDEDYRRGSADAVAYVRDYLAPVDNAVVWDVCRRIA